MYILRGNSDPSRHYVGISSNPDERLHWHNEGPCGHEDRHNSRLAPLRRLAVKEDQLPAI